MTPEEVYEKYLALKLHFTTDSYDYFKYNGKTRATQETFDKRRDRFQFTKLSRNFTSKDMEGLFVSNFVAGATNEWVGYYNSKEAKALYMRWLKGVQSLSYVVSEESKKIKREMAEKEVTLATLFHTPESKHPLLLGFYYADQISLETLIVYAAVFKFLPKWNREIDDDIIWPETNRIIHKYRPFLNIDVEKFKPIIREAMKGE